MLAHIYNERGHNFFSPFFFLILILFCIFCFVWHTVGLLFFFLKKKVKVSNQSCTVAEHISTSDSIASVFVLNHMMESDNFCGTLLFICCLCVQVTGKIYYFYCLACTQQLDRAEIEQASGRTLCVVSVQFDIQVGGSVKNFNISIIKNENGITKLISFKWHTKCVLFSLSFSSSYFFSLSFAGYHFTTIGASMRRISNSLGFVINIFSSHLLMCFSLPNGAINFEI